MIWATKRIQHDQLHSIKLLFCDQVAAFDQGQQMLLIGVKEDQQTTQVWVSFVDHELLTPYIGFMQCNRNALPIAPMLIAGNPKRFADIFHM